MAFAAWPHQTFAREETHRRIARGVRSLCITSPTGSGKSAIMRMLLEDFVAQGLTCAIFTNRRLLTSQLSRALNDAGIHLGIRAAQFESWADPNAPVQVCSLQTEVARVIKKRERAVRRSSSEDEAMRAFSLFPAQRVIVDEAHLQGGDQMTGILKEYCEKYNAIPIGITATPLGVSHLYDELLVAANNSQLREIGALVPAYCYEPASFDVWKIRRTKSGVYSQKEMEDKVKAIWSQHVVAEIYEQWMKLNPDGRPAMCMAPGVKEALGLAQDFQRQGINAAHIDGEGLYVDGKYYHTTEQEDRDELFERAKNHDIPIIFNRYVLREAVDLPFLEQLILATPIASLTAYLQVVGRVLRACPATGKDRAIIVDHGGSVRMHGSPNLDRDHEWMKYFKEQPDKITHDRLESLRDPDHKEAEPITCPKCSMIRKTGPKCPGCGHEHDKSVRMVIQESGDLVAVKGDMFPKRRVTVKANTVSLWTGYYWACKNAKRPMSFSQARAAFKHDHHYWPPKDLPLMPKDPADWTRKIKSVEMSDLIPKPPVQGQPNLFKGEKS